MKRIKIFISSIQTEFANERSALYEYLVSDPLLGKFFEPFLFEMLPAIDQRTDVVYLKEVEQNDIYLGLLGKSYGITDNTGVSPTEKEFNHATKHHKTRLVFLTNHVEEIRDTKVLSFISRAQEVLIRKRFGSIDELKSAVYASLVHYLVKKELVRTSPFDTTINKDASIDSLNTEKILMFVRSARAKRGFSLSEQSPIKEILTHLNLINENRITNAAILLFGEKPQHFFINSEIRCAHFYGTEVEKPIPSYKVFKGDVFELVNKAVEFVLSKLDYSVGTRKEKVEIPGSYEIPKEIIAEAIVNAVAHRDYTSNGSIQVMLFKDRLEVWNPGTLPMGWTTEKLKQLHSSIPANPLLAEPMYLAGYIERLGTGTADIVRIAKKEGLKEPEFIQHDSFTVIIYRPEIITGQATGQVTGQATGQVDQYLRKIILALNNEMKRAEIMTTLKLNHRENFNKHYLEPAIQKKLIEQTYPYSPNHPKQKYRLTQKGKRKRKELEA